MTITNHERGGKLLEVTENSPGGNGGIRGGAGSAAGTNDSGAAIGGVPAVGAKGSGKAGATVRYDGHALDFPQWRETWPLEQAVANAAWIRDWLTKAVGEPVPVRPILLLPGWWVERKGRGEVMVGNAKEIGQMVTGGRPAGRISDVLQKRIVHQLDQRCRDVEPGAYSNQ